MTHTNFKMIHDFIYEQFVEANIGTESMQTKIHDGEGNLVYEEDLMVGLSIKHELIHPDHLLMVDEIGSNLHCDHDYNVGGEKHVFGVGSDHSTIRINNNDCRFSLLGFSSADGQPAMFIEMIKAKRLSYKLTQGTDMNVPLFECSDPIE